MQRYLMVAWLLLLTACQPNSSEPIQSYVFGTLIDIHLPEQTPAKAEYYAAQLNQQFRQLHQQLHAWQSDSELSQLNQALAKGQSMNVSPRLAEILLDAQYWSAQTQGLFNPAIGHLIQAWGFHRDQFTPIQVQAETIEALRRAHPEMSQLHIHEQTVLSDNPAVNIDLGAYAKGYALDMAARYLRQQGVKQALINIGGNIIALGQHGNMPWRVGIQHPRAAGPMALLDLPDGWAVGTSGDYQRYYEWQGQRYCHVIDPRSGAPVQGTQSVTVLIPPSAHAGVLSDVASKPLFIEQQQAARLALAKAMHVDNFLIVEASGHVLISAAMQQRLHWVKPPADITVVP